MPTKRRSPSEGAASSRLRGSSAGVSGRASQVSLNGAASGSGREGAHVAEMQRRRLLLAFTEVLSEDGLEDARVGRVCARAGVSRRTFYDLFDDREACFLAVLDSAVERISQRVLPVFTREGRWRERIRAALAALLELFDEDPALARVCLIETLKAGPGVSQRRGEVLDALIGAVDEGRGESKGGVEPSPLTAQSAVGGAISVLYARVLEDDARPLLELLNPLMSMIVHPYLGSAAARRELDHRVPAQKPARNAHAAKLTSDPFRDLPIRLTFRTARVLTAIGAQPGASNRQIADAAGVTDQGQISRLLNRLEGFELIENHGQGHTKGEPNAWTLTQRGHGILQAIGEDGVVSATPACGR
jgi:AcrR family transcriptional regulator